MDLTWELREQDRELFARELESFVPDKIYDVHGHLFRRKFWPKPPFYETVGPADVGLEVYREQMQWLFPGREVHGMHFPLAFVENTAPGNAWVSKEIKKDRLARGQFLVKPTDDPEWVRQEVKKLGLRGLKPFSIYSPVDKTFEAEIPTFLPEELVKVADQESWTITLHIMRSRGIADESNQHWIGYYCRTYPGMQLILDHCARGFNPYHVLEGLPKLMGLDNLWIDTSVVCNALAIQAALQILGPERVLYGSDYDISHFRGTNVSTADTFIWLYENNPVWEKVRYNPGISPTLVGLENLRAIKAACWAVSLSDSQVADFFWTNAARLLAVG